MKNILLVLGVLFLLNGCGSGGGHNSRYYDDVSYSEDFVDIDLEYDEIYLPYYSGSFVVDGFITSNDTYNYKYVNIYISENDCNIETAFITTDDYGNFSLTLDILENYENYNTFCVFYVESDDVAVPFTIYQESVNDVYYKANKRSVSKEKWDFTTFTKKDNNTHEVRIIGSKNLENKNL